MENPTHKKIPSTLNFGNDQFKLSITLEKKENLVEKILDKNEIISKYNTNDSNSILNNNNKNSLYSNINNSLYSNINNLKSGNKNKSNIFKSLISGNSLYTFNNKVNNNDSKNLFRMTVSKTNCKSHLSRGSLYDDYLKKNHPENIRKTMLKKSLFSSISKINEGIKENESESEEKKENEELKNILKLKYSLSFDDDDENEENEDDISLNNKEEDLKLFNLLDNENDEEIKELKKIYFENKKCRI